MLSLTTSKKFYDKYLFDINDYKIEKEIKGGSYGLIHVVRNIKNDQIYITKTNTPADPQYKLHISREINILIRIQHETMVPFRGFSYIDFEKRNNLTILMDYMKNGSLTNFIKDGISEKCPEFTPTIRQIILIGIARGMMLLHKLNVIHRDLKPDNILLDSNLHPHITDFGLSKFFDKNKATEQTGAGLGTIHYMAPEVINDSNFDIKADVYSFGILMYEVVTGKSAFSHIDKIGIFPFLKKITNGTRPIIKKGTIKQKGLRVMMKMCWDENPRNRPSFSEIFKKLSLSTNDFLLGFENNPEKEIININKEDPDDDADEIAKEDEKAKEMIKKGINTRFCLEGVDYDQVSRYVDEILVEPKNIKEEEMKDLKKEIVDLKEITKSQASLIEQLQKSKRQKEKMIDDDKVEIKDLKLEINELKEVTKCQAVLIEQLHKSKRQKEITIDNDKEEINDLKNEVISLKKRSKSQTKLIQQLQLSNEKKDDNELENLKSEVKDLKKHIKKQKSVISSLKSDLENNSNQSQYQEIFDSIMEKVGQMNKQQQEKIKQQQEKIDRQEETIRQQKEKIEQQQIDIMNQFEIFKKQLKELNDKLDQKNSEENQNKTVTSQFKHSNKQSDDEKFYIEPDQIIERKIKLDSDDEKITATDSDTEQKEEDESDKGKESDSYFDEEKETKTESDKEKELSSNSDKEKESSSDSDKEKESDSDSDIEKETKTESDKEKESSSDSDKEKDSSSNSDNEKESDSNSDEEKDNKTNSDSENGEKVESASDSDKNEKSEDEDDESKKKYKLIKSLKYDQVPLGFIDYLKDKVFISAGGNSANVNCIRSIASSGFNNWINFEPSNENESFIEFDFGTEFRVELESYVIHPYKQRYVKIYPKSWQIIGSNDQSKWVLLDEKEDELTLKNNITEHFYCQNSDEDNRFRYIRFIQLDSWSPSNNKPYYVSISFFELFGDLYGVE